MDNKEAVLDALNEFERKTTKEITPILEEYLTSIAKTGNTIFPWLKLRPVLIQKMDSTLTESNDETPMETLTPIPNVENVNFVEMKDRLLNVVNNFNGAPFTIQRLCELIMNPQQHYKRIDKFMRAIEKNLTVVSSVDHMGNKIVSDNSRRMIHSTPLVNGVDGHHQPSNNNASVGPFNTPGWFNTATPSTTAAWPTEGPTAPDSLKSKESEEQGDYSSSDSSTSSLESESSEEGSDTPPLTESPTKHPLATGDAGKEAQPTLATGDAGKEAQPTLATEDAGKEAQPTLATEDTGKEAQPPLATKDAGNEAQPPLATQDQTKEALPLQTDAAESVTSSENTAADTNAVSDPSQPIASTSETTSTPSEATAVDSTSTPDEATSTGEAVSTPEKAVSTHVEAVSTQDEAVSTQNEATSTPVGALDATSVPTIQELSRTQQIAFDKEAAEAEKVSTSESTPREDNRLTDVDETDGEQRADTLDISTSADTSTEETEGNTTGPFETTPNEETPKTDIDIPSSQSESSIQKSVDQSDLDTNAPVTSIDQIDSDIEDDNSTGFDAIVTDSDKSNTLEMDQAQTSVSSSSTSSTTESEDKAASDSNVDSMPVVAGPPKDDDDLDSEPSAKMARMDSAVTSSDVTSPSPNTTTISHTVDSVDNIAPVTGDKDAEDNVGDVPDEGPVEAAPDTSTPALAPAQATTDSNDKVSSTDTSLPDTEAATSDNALNDKSDEPMDVD